MSYYFIDYLLIVFDHSSVMLIVQFEHTVKLLLYWNAECDGFI